LRVRYDYVFTTGGIGPTHDDITSEAVAAAFAVPLLRDPEATRRLRERYGAEELNDMRMRMANIPQGAELIDNPISVAPGFRLDNVFVLAGVPAIARAMFEGIVPQLQGGARLRAITVECDLGEGILAADLAELARQHTPASIGSYPFLLEGAPATRLVARSALREPLQQLAEALEALVLKHGGHATRLEGEDMSRTQRAPRGEGMRAPGARAGDPGGVP
jgi:molybdopterin-biosynthesis enzyme MoeA-like protein